MQIRSFYTDHWKAYESILPADKHVQSKVETYNIEGLNSMIRHYLVRFRRKTISYSKSQERIVYSLNLLFNRRCTTKYDNLNMPVIDIIKG